MLQLILSKDWVAVRDEMLRRIACDVQNRLPGRILMVPELISHDAERRLCGVAGDTASRYAEVLSFPRLARKVADSMGNVTPNCMDDGGRIATMAAAARQLHSRLKAYASVETKPEFLSDMVNAVDEMKRCCIGPADLAEASAKVEGSLAQKLEELSLLLGAYDGLCAQGKKDPRDLMNWLLQQLQDGEFGENHVFYVDGFPDFTRQHMAILEHLIRVCPQVVVGLNCDEVNSFNLAFEKAGDTAFQLMQCAKRWGVEVEIQVLPARKNDLLTVCNTMFQGQLQEGRFGDCLHVVKAQSPFQEVQYAVWKIMQWVQAGCRYRDIAVVCTDMATYRDFMHLWSCRCGIPMYESGTESVLHKNGINTVLFALEAVFGGFERDAVLRYLRSGLTPLSMDACDRLENYAILWGVRGNRWFEVWENHPRGLEDKWFDSDRKELEDLNGIRTQAMEPLRAMKEAFRCAEKLADQVQAVSNFLERIQFAQALQNLAEETDASGDNRGAQILNQIWDILVGALVQLHDVLGETVWEEEAFLRLLTLLLSQYNVGTIPPVLDAVMFGPVNAMRCQQEKHLIVLGAEEGKLPGYGGSTGLLSDQERVAIRKLGLPLTGGAMEGIQAEFAEIYGVFCGAGESITVSCSGTQPSYVYRRLEKMVNAVECPRNIPGPEWIDSKEAGIYLNRTGDRKTAQDLGVLSWYEEANRQLSYTMGNMEKENVEKLYGDVLHLSASQVSRHSECVMAYFLEYGLRAKERKEAEVNPAEFGSYVHKVLEKTAEEVMTQGGFHKVSLKETMEIALSYAQEYEQEHFAQLESQRLRYLLLRNRQELDMVVEELWQELSASQFAPKAMELSFGDGKQLPAIPISGDTMDAKLRGFVDRVDVWQREGRNYFRVVDYKTGKKNFDYCDVYNGVGLQMLLYLFALEAGDYLGENPVGAGVQYFPARASVLAVDGNLSEEEAEKVRSSEWKRKGLLLNDPEVLKAMDPDATGRLCCTFRKDGTITGDVADSGQMKCLKNHVMKLLKDMVNDIASGNVKPNPYTRGEAFNACTYCPYGAVCHQATVTGRRNYKAMKAPEFWEKLGKEE